MTDFRLELPRNIEGSEGMRMPERLRSAAVVMDVCESEGCLVKATGSSTSVPSVSASVSVEVVRPPTSEDRLGVGERQSLGRKDEAEAIDSGVVAESLIGSGDGCDRCPCMRDDTLIVASCC